MIKKIWKMVIDLKILLFVTWIGYESIPCILLFASYITYLLLFPKTIANGPKTRRSCTMFSIDAYQCTNICLYLFSVFFKYTKVSMNNTHNNLILISCYKSTIVEKSQIAVNKFCNTTRKSKFQFKYK